MGTILKMRNLAQWTALAVTVVFHVLLTISAVASDGTLAAERNGTPPPDALHLASVHALVGGLHDGPLFMKHAERQVPIASITKLMTAMVILDAGQPLDEWVTIVERDRPAPANAWTRLRIGSEARRGDLLRISLMSSENLATHVLARNYPGGVDAFVAEMNAKARSLGMTQTRFADATGLSTDNRSTARDLVKLARAAYDYETIREFSVTGQYDVRFRQPRYTLSYANTNPLTRSERWDVALSKTGYLNDAGRCPVMVATVGDEPLVFVLLDSYGMRSPIGDAGRVRRWLETGASGPVAGAARDYERQRSATYRQQITAAATTERRGGEADAAN
jgi:serine-type D-Ala-D-Ala endopeptidase (penicillin-binding protein 7)